MPYLTKRTPTPVGRLSVVLAVGVALMSTACIEGPVDDAAGTVEFSPLETDEISTKIIPRPTLVNPEAEDQIAEIVDGFSQNAAAFFAKGAAEGHLSDTARQRLPQIEQIFLSSGNSLELMGIYQNVVHTQGMSSPAAPQLARLYLRLGQQRLARTLLDKMIVRRGDQADVWFLNGAYWMDKVRDSPKAAARIVANWQKAIDIDPDYGRGAGRDQRSFRRQLEALRKRVPLAKVARAAAELEAKADGNTAETKTVADGSTTVAQTGFRGPPGSSNESEPGRRVDADQNEEGPTPADRPDQPSPDASTSDKPEPVAVIVARGQMAMAEGESGRAGSFFDRALRRDPDNAAARLGRIQNGWSNSAKRPELTDSLRTLADRGDLSARQQYEIGLVAFSKLNDRQLAARLWKSARKRDPVLAESVNLDDLIDQTSN